MLVMPIACYAKYFHSNQKRNEMQASQIAAQAKSAHKVFNVCFI